MKRERTDKKPTRKKLNKNRDRYEIVQDRRAENTTRTTEEATTNEKKKKQNGETQRKF